MQCNAFTVLSVAAAAARTQPIQAELIQAKPETRHKIEEEKKKKPEATWETNVPVLVLVLFLSDNNSICFPTAYSNVFTLGE